MENKTDEELKAMGYDLILKRDLINQQILVINTELSKRLEKKNQDKKTK